MADVEIATVLPKELRLGVPPKMPQARTYLYRQQSVLPTASPSGTITINIPRLQRSYLRKDSYLRFRVAGSWNPGTNTQISLNLDTCGALGFIERIEVFDYLGSTVLETISGIPQLSSLLLDLGMKEFVVGKNGNAELGLGRDMCINTGPGTFDNKAFSSNTDPQAYQNYTFYSDFYPCGMVYNSTAGDLIATSTGSINSTQTSNIVPFCHEFGFSLPSFLGLLSDRMVPLHNGFTIVLTLASRTTPFFISQNVNSTISTNTNGTISNKKFTPLYTEPAADALTWELQDINMDCQILELGPEAESMMMESSQGSPLVVYTKSFRNYMGVIRGASWNTTANTKFSISPPITFPCTTKAKTNWAANTEFVNTTPTFTPGTTTATTYYNVKDLAAALQTLFTSVWTVTYTTDNRIIWYPTAASTSALLAGTFFTDNSLLFQAGAGWPSYTPVMLNANNSTAPTTTGQSEFVLNMNLNVASMTDLLWIMRPTSNLDTLLYQSSGFRTRNFLHRWQFQYGSTTLPQSNGVQCMTTTLPNKYGSVTSISGDQAYTFSGDHANEAYNELLKSRPLSLDNCRIDERSFKVDYKLNDNLDRRIPGPNTLTTLNKCGVMPSSLQANGIGQFAGGLNLQLVPNKEGQIVSGLNTNGMNTSIRGNFHPLYTDFMDTVRVDAWAEYDAFINISPGIATTVSF